MATDLGDAGGIAGSTLQGAAAGSAFGPWGAAVGGTIGFFSGLFSNSAENKAEALEELQIQRAKIAAGLEGEAREIQLALNAFEVDRARKQLVNRALVAGEAITSAAVASNLTGSSIAANARSSILQQKASNLQASFLTENAGNQISELLQEASDAALGLNDVTVDTMLKPFTAIAFSKNDDKKDTKPTSKPNTTTTSDSGGNKGTGTVTTNDIFDNADTMNFDEATDAPFTGGR